MISVPSSLPRLYLPPKPPDGSVVPTPPHIQFRSHTAATCFTETQYSSIVFYMSMPTTIQVFDEIPRSPAIVQTMVSTSSPRLYSPYKPPKMIVVTTMTTSLHPHGTSLDVIEEVHRGVPLLLQQLCVQGFARIRRLMTNSFFLFQLTFKMTMVIEIEYH